MSDSGKRVAIVGAGVMGLCAAHALRSRNVTVFDPNPTQNASSMAGGMLAPFSEIEHLPENFQDAAEHGIQFWKKFPSFTQNGSLLVAHDGDEYILDRLAQKISGYKIIDGKKIAALEPSLNFKRGIFIPEEAHIDPRKALTALAANVNIRAETADIQKLQKEYDYVLDCRGFAAEKDDAELRGVKGEIALVRNIEFSLLRPVRLMHPRYPLYIVPREDNIFMIGATVIESEDKAVTLKSAMELLSAAYSLHPSFAESEIIGIQAGVRPAYPDNLPRLKIDGTILRCNGLFRHGYLLAPALAACAADFVDGRENPFISLFRRNDDVDHNQRAEKKRQLRA